MPTSQNLQAFFTSKLVRLAASGTYDATFAKEPEPDEPFTSLVWSEEQKKLQPKQ